MANFRPAGAIEYEGQSILLRTDGAVLYDTAQGVRIWGDELQDNYSIGDTSTGGVDATYGTNNLAFGQYALNSVQATGSTKSSNIGIGTYSLSQLSSTASLGTSNDNIAIGTNTGKLLKKGATNILIGKDVLATYSSTTLLTSSVFIGTSVAKFPTTVGNTNTAVGSGLLSSTGLLSVGSNNTLLGSLIASTATVTSVGSSSVFIGSNIGNGSFTSLPSQTVYIGYIAGNTFTSTSAANSVYVGYLAGQTSLANTFNNVVIGSQANSLGDESVVLGTGAGSNIATSAAVSNIIVGFSAGSGITSGNSNIIIGSLAGGDISSGSGNIIIASDYGGQTGSNNIEILTSIGTKGIQYIHSTGILSLKSTKANIEGRLTVGSTTAATVHNIYMPGTLTGGTTAYGVLDTTEVQSDVTSFAYHFFSQPKVAAGHGGLGRLDHFTAQQGVFNNATVTSQYGFFAGSTLQDAVANTAFYGNVQLNNKNVVTMSQSGTTVTAVTSIAHTLKIGSFVSIMGCSDSSFDISRAEVTGISTTTVLNDTFTFTVTTSRTVGSTAVDGSLTDLSDLNLEMYGPAPNVINGYILAGRQLAYFDSMQVTQTPGGAQIFPNNQFVGGIAAVNNSANLSYGAHLVLFKNNSTVATDMTATPTGMNIGHIYWSTTDGRKYINAGSILMRTTAATTAATAGGGGATTNMIFNVANNAMPSEVGKFTALGLEVLATQINTGTKANTAWLASGTANSTTFLRGDGTWATATGTATTPSIARTFALMGA